MTGPASAPPILFDIRGDIAWVTLNRPASGNAIDLPMAYALVEAAIRCDTDTAIRCVVITGAGRLFCAGGDVGLMRTAHQGPAALLNELAGVLHMALVRFACMQKPLLVLVNGPAAGAGLSLALAGDVVIASPAAHFTAAYGAIGLTPDGGMSWLLPRLVGLRKAQEIILTNRRIMADEAERIGLVTRLAEEGRLVAEGEETAASLAASAVAALGAARSLLQESFCSSYEAQLGNEVRAIVRAGAGAECREGLSAMSDKRPPRFSQA